MPYGKKRAIYQVYPLITDLLMHNFEVFGAGMHIMLVSRQINNLLRMLVTYPIGSDSCRQNILVKVFVRTSMVIAIRWWICGYDFHATIRGVVGPLSFFAIHVAHIISQLLQAAFAFAVLGEFRAKQF